MLKPYPIYDPAGGLDLAREPWLTPDKALRSSRNCRYWRGRILKRGGKRFFGDLSIAAELVEMTGLIGASEVWTPAYAPRLGPANAAALPAPVARAVANLDAPGTQLRQSVLFAYAPDTPVYDFGNGKLGMKQLVLGSPYVAAPTTQSGSFAAAIAAGGKLIPGTLVVRDAGTGQVANFDADGLVSGSIDRDKYNFVDYTAGRWAVTFAVPPTGAVSATAEILYGFRYELDGVNLVAVSPNVLRVALPSGRRFVLQSETSAAGIGDLVDSGRFSGVNSGEIYAFACRAGQQYMAVTSAGVTTPDVVFATLTTTPTGKRLDWRFVEPYKKPIAKGYYAETVTVTAATSARTYQVSLPNGRSFRRGPPIKITNTATSQEIQFDAQGVPSGHDPSMDAWVDYENGVAMATFPLSTTGAVTATASIYCGDIDYDTGEFHYRLFSPYTTTPLRFSYYNKNDNNAPKGLIRWGDTLLALDCKRLYVYDGTKFDPQTPEFTAGPGDFFTFAPVPTSTAIVFANGVDPLRSWNGSTLAEVRTDWVTPSSREIDTARIVLFHRNRLVALATKERGVWRFQRWRATEVDPNLGSPASWRSGKLYGDAPTDEKVVWARVVNDEIFVGFERSMWWLEWRDDPREPFRWRPVTNIDGAASRHAGVILPSPSGEVAAVWGNDSIFGIARQGTERLDASIPDYAAERASAGAVVHAGLSRLTREALWAHASVPGSDTPDALLALQYESGTWSIYDIPVHALGQFRARGDVAWDDVDGTWENDASFDGRLGSLGSTITLGADRNMRVWALFDSDSDDGDAIRMVVRTAMLSPFRDSERNGVALVRCGYVDVIGTAGREVTFRAYRDFSTQPYIVERQTLVGSGALGRARFTVNSDATLHGFEIEESSPHSFAVDAIIPWFEDAGTTEWEL